VVPEESDAPQSVAPDVSEAHPESDNWIWMGKHRPAIPRALVELRASGWAPGG
jgi:hypothetical protein